MMTEATTPATTAPTNTGPQPVTMADIYQLIGALHLEIEVLRRQNAHLTEQLAALKEG
jgi:hypothetical protein